MDADGQSNSNEPLKSGLGSRPPFVEFPGKKEVEIPLASFIDEGDCTIREDFYGSMCKAFFLKRHGLPQNARGMYMLRRLLANDEIIRIFRDKKYAAARSLYVSQNVHHAEPDWWKSRKEYENVAFRGFTMSTPQHWAALLLEIYGHTPDRFSAMMSWRRMIGSLRMDTMMEFASLSRIRASLRDFVLPSLLKIEENDKGCNVEVHFTIAFCNTVINDLSNLETEYESFVSSVLDSHESKNDKTRWVRQVWDEPITFRWVLGAYEYGLNLTLYQNLKRINDKHLGQLTYEFSKRLSASPRSDDQDDDGAQENLPFLAEHADMETKADKIDDVWEKPDSRPDTRRNHFLLFGVKGCGKTRRIFDYLKSNFGFYILSGCDLPEGRTSQADTQRLYRAIAELYDNSSGEDGLSYMTGIDVRHHLYYHWIETFVCLKFWLFKNFCKAAKEHQQKDSSLYRLWLQHQIDVTDVTGLPAYCRDMFEIARFLNPRKTLPQAGYNLGARDPNEAFFPYWVPEKFYTCFDEIQTDYGSARRLLTPLLDMQHTIHLSFHSMEYPQYQYTWTSVISGTALRLQDIDPYAASMLEKARTRNDMKDKDIKHAIKIDFVFDTVTDFAKSWAGLIDHAERILREIAQHSYHAGNEFGLIESSARFCSEVFQALRQGQPDGPIEPEDITAIIGLIEQQKQDIVMHGTPLRGRHLWSSRYMQLNLADAIRQHMGSGPSESGFTPESRSKIVQTEAIEDLRKTLDRLRKEKPQLYQNICWLAIRADLLNKPTVFAENGAAELVTLGFAMAKSDWTDEHDGAITIEEPLAIKAVLEHLSTDNEGQKELQRQMNNWLFMSQDNPTMLGEVSEYYLACAVDGMFRRSEQLISPQRRSLFLDHLQNNLKFISTDVNATASWTKPTLTDFDLYIPDKDYASFVEHGELYEWMKDVRKSAPNIPRICFPPQKAGPDLVFCLDQETGNGDDSKILVAIQLKTKNNASVEGAINTIDPNLWYISTATFGQPKIDMQKAMAKELEEWSGAANQYRIYSLFVATSDIVKSGADEVCKSYRKPEKRKERCRRLYDKDSNLLDVEKECRDTDLLSRLPNKDYPFCVVDKDQTRTLFGDAFAKLIHLVKK